MKNSRLNTHNKGGEKMKIVIYHKGKTYDFKYGYEAMIFDCAISNSFDTIYGECATKNFVHFVSECFLKAPHTISLGDLADFIASKWMVVKELSYYEILEIFYNSVSQ